MTLQISGMRYIIRYMQHYTYRIIIEPDDGGTFHAYVPSLPGCHTWGDSWEEARANVKEAMRAYLASLVADNEIVPEERGVEAFETITHRELQPIHP